MRKIAANYIFPVSGSPIKNGYVKVDDNGVVVDPFAFHAVARPNII